MLIQEPLAERPRPDTEVTEEEEAASWSKSTMRAARSWAKEREAAIGEEGDTGAVGSSHAGTRVMETGLEVALCVALSLCFGFFLLLVLWFNGGTEGACASVVFVNGKEWVKDDANS